jgi:hypothetical protein
MDYDRENGLLDWSRRDWSFEAENELSDWMPDEHWMELVPTVSIRYEDKRGFVLYSLWRGDNIVACWDQDDNQFSLHHAYTLLFDHAKDLGLID